MDTEIATGKISITEVELDVVGLSKPLVLVLSSAVETYIDVTSPYAPVLLCQACLPRLQLSPVERVLLGFIISDSLVRNRVPYTYADLGKIIGREASTIERAAMALRHVGLIRTRRIGVRSRSVAFDCQPYLEWGRRVLARPMSSAARTETADAVTLSETTDKPAAPARSSAPSARHDVHTPQEFDDVSTFVDRFDPDDHPDWPDVPGNWRALHKIPFPWDDIPSVSVPVGKKPWLGPVPRLPNGEYDRDKLTRKPYQLMDPDGDEISALCACEAHSEEPQELDPYAVDEPVDPRPEIDATLMAAGGRRPNADDDEFDISSGTDTDETDMDPRVPINVDL